MPAPIDITPLLPAILTAMVRVSRASFYATLGQLNAYPYPEGKHDMLMGYLSRWKDLRTGVCLGFSIGSPTFGTEAYFVTPAFYDSNRSALECHPAGVVAP